MMRAQARPSCPRCVAKGGMAKKRVYELAKDLGLSNKEMVEWLHGHEYDVKSHSSSLEDDQAQAVIEKFKGEKAPKPVAPKPSGSGVVLRRKRADTAAEAEHEHAEPPKVAEPPVAPVARHQPPAEVHVEPVRTPVIAEEPAIVVAAEQKPAALKVEEPVAAEKAAPLPVAAAPIRPEPVARPEPAVSRTAEPSRMPPPQTSNVPAGVAKVAARPAPPPPIRPTVRAPPPKPTGPIVQGPGGVQSVQVTENIAARPSATRAVVLSRPLLPIARPAPRPPP